MKSSEEMARAVLRRYKAEEARQKSRRALLRKWSARVISTACCAVFLAGAFTLWLRLVRTPATASPGINTPDTTESTLPAETTAPPETTILTEPPLQTAPAESRGPAESLEPMERKYRFSLMQLVLEEGKTVSHLVLRGDGESILENLQLEGLTPETVFPMLVKPLVGAGYIAGDQDSAPVLLLAAYDRNGYDKNGNLYEVVERDSLGAVISTALAEQGITQRILERNRTDAEYTESLEEIYGASTEYFLPVLEQIRQARKTALEENASRIIVELFTVDVDREFVVPKYQVGDYDQYGELIRYGAGTEPPAPARSLEDMSEEERRILESIYTPEDLAMMLRERTWTTMTNVVGMHEDEAGALLRSRGIVPRVCYENNEAYRLKGFTDGQVFMQDTSAGKRINSDSHVMLWVMAQTEPGRNGLSQGWHPEEAEYDPTQSQDCIGEPEVIRQHVMKAWTGEFSEEKLKTTILAYPGVCDGFEGSVNMVTFTVDFEPVSCSVSRLAAVSAQDIGEELKGYIDFAPGCNIQGQKVMIDTGWWLDHTGEWTQSRSLWSYLVRLTDAQGETHYYYFRVNYRKA